MDKKIMTFIYSIYVAIVISICGYFYINPLETGHFKYSGVRDESGYTKYVKIWVTEKLDYTNFKYSILVSIVIGILLFSFLRLFKKPQK
jgi:hypothetical protein